MELCKSRVGSVWCCFYIRKVIFFCSGFWFIHLWLVEWVTCIPSWWVMQHFFYPRIIPLRYNKRSVHGLCWLKAVLCCPWLASIISSHWQKHTWVAGHNNSPCFLFLILKIKTEGFICKHRALCNTPPPPSLFSIAC